MNLVSSKSFAAAAAIFVFGAAHAQIAKPSVDQQIKLGKQAADEIRKKERVLPSTDARVVLLRRIANRLVGTFPSGEPWRYTFDVIESKQVNAFALPGGPMFFYTGLMDKLKTEDQVAGVIGHELTHVRKEHWARQYAKEQNRNIWLTLGLTVLHVNSDLANVASVVNSTWTLRFSRDAENEADERGFDTVSSAGFNPQGMADVFRILQAEAGSGSYEFLSDHPSDKNRIKKIETKVKESSKTFPTQVPLPTPAAVTSPPDKKP